MNIGKDIAIFRIAFLEVGTPNSSLDVFT